MFLKDLLPYIIKQGIQENTWQGVDYDYDYYHNHDYEYNYVHDYYYDYDFDYDIITMIVFMIMILFINMILIIIFCHPTNVQHELEPASLTNNPRENTKTIILIHFSLLTQYWDAEWENCACNVFPRFFSFTTSSLTTRL